ncbi:MAG: 2-oxoacid:acceptor oxidoreductase family protein [Clostridia bacterium]|nr:2-oxoacid:acceptor oxidoreductase family protein [Clostridia bacterium]
MNKEILIAGFGGQGILFSGKFLAYGGLIDGKEVSWLPSYGPEMRGGTANCSIILSDNKIGSPIVDKPDVLIAMNAPSFDKYITEVKSGGMAIVDSSLIDKKSERDDVEAYYIPATRLASENGLTGLANMIILGLFLKKTNLMTDELIDKVMKKIVPAKKPQLYDLNMKAIQLGFNYEA